MRNGFSLVELSIVLVILGLLTGGILAGQSLIRASELRSLSVDLNKYTTAVYAFRDKYFAFPGDFNNAKAHWPSCTDGTNNSCNGDGDGHIWRVGGGCTNGNYSMESARVWQHLSLAGLIEGDYSLFNGGTCANSLTYGRPGATVPQLRIDKVGVILASSTATALLNRKTFTTGNAFSDSLESSYLTPEEAWNIDVKMDDGMPRMGKIWSSNGHSTLFQTNCYSSNTAYMLNTKDKHCRIVAFLD